jgi:hypothetical protein
MRNAYIIFIGKPEVKRPFERPKRRWQDSIKMDLKVRGCILDSGGAAWAL